MRANFKEIAREYLGYGLSVLPINDDKSPSIKSWKELQEKPMTHFEVEKYFNDAKGIGIVTGKVSGGLEVVDVDAKYCLTGTLWPDLSKLIQDNLDSIYDKLLIAKTKNNGYHIYYHSEVNEGNQRLAVRHATTEEQQINTHVKIKVLIETRGCGGYVVSSPSQGYGFIQGNLNNIPKISEKERELLLAICRSFNEVVENDKSNYQQGRNHSSNLSNPFADYNENGDIEELMFKYGWTKVYASHDRIHFKRPGETSSKTSANWHTTLRTFYVFSSSTNFEPNKAYNLSMVFARLECNGDIKLASSKLKSMGYGSIPNGQNKKHSQIEKSNNMDESDAEEIPEAKSKFRLEPIRLNELAFGYGLLMFKYTKEAKAYLAIGLYHDEIRNMLHSQGYFKRLVGNTYLLIKQTGCFIKEVKPEDHKTEILKIIDDLADDIWFNFENENYFVPLQALRELFLKQGHLIFNETWLQNLTESTEPILKDTETEMFFAFKNGLVKVNKSDIGITDWKNVKGICIWESQVINREFKLTKNYKESQFYSFLQNISNSVDERLDTMQTALGYLMHYYFRDSEGQAVIFYDETITDIKTPQGGSGKGLLINSIKQIRNVVKIDGKHFDVRNRFRFEQLSPAHQVVWYDDIKPDFEFSNLHSNLTDGYTVETKFKPQFVIKPKDNPKTVICSNSIIKGGGSTNKRRQHIVEVGDYYSKQIKTGNEKPIEEEHGGLFFSNQWSSDEWNNFFNLMVRCGQKYLLHGFIPFEGINIKINTFRQETNEDFFNWVESQKFTIENRYPTKDYYQTFIDLFYAGNVPIGQRTFTGWLKHFANFKSWTINISQSNGKSYFIFSKGASL